MMWKILGIEPTKDKKVIADAYRNQLRNTNPEDKPEEFKQLRAAYEEAMAYASMEEVAEEKVSTPITEWLKEVDTVYRDFRKRIDVMEWRRLLTDRVCIALDLKPEAEEKLLVYLMDHWFLPQEVWQLIDDTFSIRERREELIQIFQADFIDYAVINGALYPPALPLDLFEPGMNGEQCDQYRNYYNALRNAGYEESLKIIEDMKKLDETHPYGEAYFLRSLLDTEEDAYALEEIEKSALNHPDDAFLGTFYISLFIERGMHERIREFLAHQLELYPDHTSLLSSQADIRFVDGDPAGAKKILFDLMEEVGPDDPRSAVYQEKLQAWNDRLIEKYEAEQSEDIRERMDLAWCYLQNDRCDEAMEVLNGINEEETDDFFAYHNLAGKILINLNDYESGIEHVKKIIPYLESLEDDGTEETRERKARLGEFIRLKGELLIDSGKEEEGIADLEKAHVMDHENANIMMKLGYCEYRRNNYYKALDHIRAVLEKRPNSAFAHFYLSKTYFGMRQDRMAFDEINEAIDEDPTQLEFYTHKLNILIANRAFEEVHEVLKFLHDSGMPETNVFAYYEAVLKEVEEGDREEALKMYKKVRTRYEKGEYMGEPQHLYYKIAWLESEKKDVTVKKNRDSILKTLNKALEIHPHDVNSLFFKAWVLRQAKKYEEALEIYKQMEKYPDHSLQVEKAMAEIYYKDLSKNLDKAYHYYSILNEAQPDNEEYLFYIGTLLRHYRRYDDAEKAFRHEMEVNPNDIDGYRGLSYVAEYRKDYEAVNELIDEMLTMEQDGNRRADLYYRKHKMYARMGVVKDAINALDLCEEAADKYYIYRAKFDIYANNGMWKELALLMQSWKKSKTDQDEYLYREIRWYMYMEDISKAESLFRKYKDRLMADKNKRHNMKRCEIDFLRYHGKWEEILKLEHELLKEDPKDSQQLTDLAATYYKLADTKSAVKFAKKAIKLLEKQMQENMAYEALYASRLILAYYLVGNIEKAKEMVSFANQTHCCESCVEVSCKDAEIYEAEVAYILGKYDEAYKLAVRGRKHNPGEFDYVYLLHRIEEERKERE